MFLSAKCIVAIAVISATTQVASAPYLPDSSRNALPPFGHTVFCLKYPKDCEQSGSPGPVADTPARHTELDSVNRHVNASIAPKKEAATLDEKWLVAPLEGNCHDYAVTKRHDLLQKGWPSSSLRLAEVTVNTGEHHLILLAEIEGEGFILDNLDPNVLSLAQTRSGYYWNRIVRQSEILGQREYRKIRKFKSAPATCDKGPAACRAPGSRGGRASCDRCFRPGQLAARTQLAGQASGLAMMSPAVQPMQAHRGGRK